MQLGPELVTKRDIVPDIGHPWPASELPAVERKIRFYRFFKRRDAINPLKAGFPECKHGPAKVLGGSYDKD